MICSICWNLYLNCVCVQVLGALVTHVGSGIRHEVSSALETMSLLATKYPRELIQLSSHITGIHFYIHKGSGFLSLLLIVYLYYSGILDYLESFSTESLHKVRNFY